MKLYRVASFTGSSGLQLREEPDPDAPGPGQVVVRLRATSINFRDLVGLKGFMQRVGTGMAPNHIPMCDGAGEVAAVGDGVTRCRPGDRVALTFHPTWISGRIPDDFNILGRSCGPNDGLLAQYTAVHQSEVVITPAHLSFEEAATLPCAGVTAWAALNGQVHLLPGDDVLVMSTGGVAVFALQLAKFAGARVIATTTSFTGRPDLPDNSLLKRVRLLVTRAAIRSIVFERQLRPRPGRSTAQLPCGGQVGCLCPDQRR